MTDAKKEPRKKTEAEKKDEKNALIDLWMNNLGETPAQADKAAGDQTSKPLSGT
ncbi:MAG: hypothetical protein ACO1RX_21370 [Candidatus Sericytochromatia bacterium]